MYIAKSSGEITTCLYPVGISHEMIFFSLVVRVYVSFEAEIRDVTLLIFVFSCRFRDW